MIKSIKLINFQSHKNSELEFHPGVNSITGQSDAGKSSILRALNWIINNKPSGDAFITHNKDKSSVILCTENDKILREKGKNVNKYNLNNSENDLEAFKTDIPDEIKNILNFNELNIQYQQDKPFLLSDSSGEVARVLNKVINLDSIDRSLANIEKMKKEYKKEYEETKIGINNIEIELEKYNWIEKTEKNLNILIKKEQNLIKKTEKIKSLQLILNKYEAYNHELKKYKEVLKFKKPVSIIIEKQKKLNEKINKYKRLSIIIDKINTINIKLKKYNSLLKFKNEINDLIKREEKLQKKQEKYQKLYTNIENYKNTFKDMNYYYDELNKLNKEYEKIKPEFCPLCGKEF